MKILVPVDGSANADRAVDFMLVYREQLKIMPELHLLNVQWKLASANIKLFINQEVINDYYREQGGIALSKARAKLDSAGIPYTYHISVGSPAEAVIQYAEAQHIDQIVMSAHGENTLATLLLGSVASKVVNLSSVPVLLVK